MKRFRKILFLLIFFIGLSACSKTSFKVEFDTDGGSPEVISSQEVISGNFVREPINPNKENYNFLYWANSESLEKWLFKEHKVTSNLTLKAIYQVKDINDEEEEENFYTLTLPSSVTSNLSKLDDIKEDTNITLTINIPIDKELVYLKLNDLEVVLTLNTYSFKINSDTVVTVLFKDKVLNETTYHEDFSNVGGMIASGTNFSEYIWFEYDGNHNITYDVLNGRIDLGLTSTTNGITLGGFGNEFGDAGLGYIEALDLKGGISYLEFKARLPFSPNSSYPQGPGKDTASSVNINVFINDNLVKTFKFTDNKTANKGETFILDDLLVTGDFTFKITVSSGHRLTLGSIKWVSNSVLTEEVEKEIVRLDFEGTKFKYDSFDELYNFNDFGFYLKEVHTDSMDPAKELEYMKEVNGSVVARFRGKNTAYLYNEIPFSHVSSLSFLAKQFGAGDFFAPDAYINIYVKSASDNDFLLLETIDALSTTNYDLFNIDINLSNVIIKIEVLGGTLNLDNIIFKK